LVYCGYYKSEFLISLQDFLSKFFFWNDFRFVYMLLFLWLFVLQGGRGHSGSMFSPVSAIELCNYVFRRVSPASLLLSDKLQKFSYSILKRFYGDWFIYKWLVWNIADYLTCVGCDTIHFCQHHA
jgi:hypothetical protein